MDVLLGIVVLSIALLSQAATLLGASREADQDTTFAGGLSALGGFVESLQSDAQWSTLYVRIRALETDTALPGDRALPDGRWAHPLTAYVPGFQLPSTLAGFWVRVEVPSAPLASDPTGPPVLREDVSSGAFGLPADLNMDGTVDGAAHDADYLVLPATLSWTFLGRSGRSGQGRLSLWLRGSR